MSRRMGLGCAWKRRDGVCIGGLPSLTPSISDSTWQSSLIHLPDNDLIWVMWSRLDHIGVVIGNNHTLLIHRKQHHQ